MTSPPEPTRSARHRTHRRRLAGLTALAVVAGLAVTSGYVGLTPVPDPLASSATSVATRPLADADDPLADTVTEQHQAELVAAEDARLLAAAGDPRVTDGRPFELAAAPAAGPATLVLPARPRPYDLAALERLGALTREPDGAWLLRRSVVVGRDAVLRIEAPGGVLRMAGGPDGFTSLVAFKGILALSGGPGAPLTVTSWDPTAGGPDRDPVDGRPYLRAHGGRLELTHLRAGELGFWSGRTGGVAWTGSSAGTASGGAIDVTVSHGHYGAFLSRAERVLLDQVVLRGNRMDGLLLHRDTVDVLAARLHSTGNGRDGVLATRGAARITLLDAVADGNGGDGIHLDGAAQADAPTAGGAGTTAGTGYRVEQSTLRDNGGVGLLVTDAGGVVARGNTVDGHTDGIVVRGTVADPEISGNTVTADRFALAVRDGVRGAVVRDNRIESAETGIQVADAIAAVTGNTVEAASHYGLSLTGAAGGSTLADNVLGGGGPAAVDLVRLATGATVAQTGTDDRGWVVQRDHLRYWTGYVVDHPLLLLWLLILLVPVAARIRAVRRRRDGVGAAPHPYRNVAPGPPTVAPDTGGVRLVPRGGDVSVPELAAAAVRTEALPITKVTIVSGSASNR